MRSVYRVVFSSFSILMFPLALQAYSSGPLPQLTGGFNEQTCVRCHSSFSLNEGRLRGGDLHLAGVPKAFSAGETYLISVIIAHPGQSRWGFELSVRHASTGVQAGQIVPADDMTQVKEAGGIQYVEHTSAGTRKGVADGPVEFRFKWIAPDPKDGSVFFNAVGNAANSSGDPAGDYIYTAGAYSGVESLTAQPVSTPKEAKKPLERVNTATRLLHLPSPKGLPKGSLIFTVQHRFLGAIVDSRPGNAFGIDLGANINLELLYAPTRRLSLGVSRARFALASRSYAPAIITYTGAYTIHDVEKSFWKLGALAGIEGQQNFRQQYSPFLQLSGSFDYKRLRTFIVPTMVFNSRDDKNLETLRAVAIHPEDDNTFSLGVGMDLALLSRLSLAAEYVPQLAGFGGFGRKRPTVAAGVNLQTWRHVFTVMVSRSRDFTPARYAVNADGDWALGFNIYRRIR
ncbi:MAG: hypothetical protein DMG10_25290 [Acidobacteria bacterium]|nr:MAG: hypothetical protein DMG10_25290 [Acidobacteriota bacterium]